MEDTRSHMPQENIPENPLELVLRGVSGIVHQQEVEKYRLQQQCAQYEQQLQALPATNIVAENKQKELTAIFNVIYKAGYVTGISMKDFMERAANVFGCPGMAKYASALYNVKTTYKYEDIFDNLRQVAQQEKNG